MNFTELNLIPEALIVADPFENTMVFKNHRAMDLIHSIGMQSDVLFSDLFADCMPHLIAFTQSVLELGENITDDLFISTDSQDISLEVTAKRSLINNQTLITFCLRDKDKLQQWRIRNDISKQNNVQMLQWHRIHEVFHQIEKENHLILSAAGEGIYGVDSNGNTTFANPAAERILGWRADELIGKNVHAAIHHSHADGSDYCVHDCPIFAAFKDGSVRKVDNEVFWTKDGKPKAVDYTSTPILDQGILVGAVVVFRDISDKKEAEEKLLNALKEVEQLKQKLELENAYLQEEISAEYNAYQIVGKSPVVKNIAQQIQLVAPTDATVLVNGESGTGKELIARAIHTASDRNGRPLVRVNCAAIPADLFESEFFGHVRGAFSGALQDRLGRFELADGGTLFLDEVGEIPIELQGKFLRVLQDSEFQKVGDSDTCSVDVRVIAASNKDLQKMVREGKFREDLYFRLNVFPIVSAALRDRKEDIPMLVSHFLAKTCRRFNKAELKVSLETIRKLQAYHWPGNIRELENIIERQVILSGGDKLVLDNLPLQQPNLENATHHEKRNPVVVTERDCKNLRYEATVKALRKAKGKLYGNDGAAHLLGVKPTTLASRIKKLGIDKRVFQHQENQASY